MGIDLLMDIAFFYVIWRFLWKKSRTKHMARAGCGSNRDKVAFAAFVIGLCFCTFVLGLSWVFGIFTPFAVFGGIFIVYFLSVRMRFGASKIEERPCIESAKVRGNRFLGRG